MGPANSLPHQRVPLCLVSAWSLPGTDHSTPHSLPAVALRPLPFSKSGPLAQRDQHSSPHCPSCAHLPAPSCSWFWCSDALHWLRALKGAGVLVRFLTQIHLCGKGLIPRLPHLYPHTPKEGLALTGSREATSEPLECPAQSISVYLPEATGHTADLQQDLRWGLGHEAPAGPLQGLESELGPVCQPTPRETLDAKAWVIS